MLLVLSPAFCQPSKDLVNPRRGNVQPSPDFGQGQALITQGDDLAFAGCARGQEMLPSLALCHPCFRVLLCDGMGSGRGAVFQRGRSESLQGLEAAKGQPTGDLPDPPARTGVGMSAAIVRGVTPDLNQRLVRHIFGVLPVQRRVITPPDEAGERGEQASVEKRHCLVVTLGHSTDEHIEPQERCAW